MTAVVQGATGVRTLLGQPPVIVGGLAVLAQTRATSSTTITWVRRSAREPPSSQMGAARHPGQRHPARCLSHRGDRELQPQLSTQDHRRAVPAGRLGDPVEIASTAVFLASPASAYVTGVSIPVDGGVLLQ